MPAVRTRRPRREPIWMLAELFPDQGDWTEEEYLNLNTNRLIEFTDGWLEVLPMPTTTHQKIVGRLYSKIISFAETNELGDVVFSPLPVRLRSGKFREPDVMFMSRGHTKQIYEKYWDSADLVVEVVSAGSENRERDFKKKRRDYARAGISEYWIVDPAEREVIVLKLSGTKYIVHGTYRPGDEVRSALWPHFRLPVNDVFSKK